MNGKSCIQEEPCESSAWLSPEMETTSQPLLSLFHLPIEVQDLILEDLSVNDLIACSKVSKSWRMGINCSRVWKKWCTLESYKIENIERYPQFPAESLDSEMGFWRKLYGWHEKLKSNWRRKLNKKFTFSEGDSGKVYSFDVLPGLVATGHEDSSIFVWSTKAKPILIAKLNGVLPHVPVLSIKLEGDFLIAVQRKLLHVFHSRNGHYELTDLKSFELGQDNIYQMGEYSALTTKFHSRYEECVRACDRSVASGPLIYNIFENSLFTHSHESGLVRIWSLPKTETSAVKEIHLEVTQISVDGKSVYLTGRDQLTYLMKYDFDASSFIALLSVPGLKRFLVGDELVVALPSPGDVSLKRIWVYRKGNYSKPIGTRTISGYSNVSLTSPYYIIYSEDASITVWNPLKNSVISHFTTETVVSLVKPTFSTFVLVFMNTSLYLWDWKSGQCIYRLYNSLEWTGHYANLLWADAFTVISGGIDYQLEMISYL